MIMHHVRSISFRFPEVVGPPPEYKDRPWMADHAEQLAPDSRCKHTNTLTGSLRRVYGRPGDYICRVCKQTFTEEETFVPSMRFNG